MATTTAVEAQKAMTTAEEKVAKAFSPDSNRNAELAIQLANAKARLHDAKMHEVKALFLVADSDLLPQSRSAAIARIAEILGV